MSSHSNFMGALQIQNKTETDVRLNRTAEFQFNEDILLNITGKALWDCSAGWVVKRKLCRCCFVNCYGSR